MSDEPTPLETLRDAVQDFANVQRAEQGHGPGLVDVSLVIWEEVAFDDDGTTMRRIRYAVPSDNFSLSSGLGLIEAAREFVRGDILGGSSEDDE